MPVPWMVWVGKFTKASGRATTRRPNSQAFPADSWWAPDPVQYTKKDPEPVMNEDIDVVGVNCTPPICIRVMYLMYFDVINNSPFKSWFLGPPCTDLI